MTPWPERGFVVTGVSRGLGRALAGALVERGSFVLGIGRSSAPALSGDRYGFVACDLADTAAIDEALAAALRAFARRGLASACLINNAAVVGPLGVASALRAPDIARALAVNLAAPAALASAFLRAFADPSLERWVVNVSSGAARTPLAGAGVYCAAKAGLEMLTRTLALEVRDPRFRAVSIRPGVIDTDMQVALRAQDPDTLPSVAMFRDFRASGRLATPEVAAERIVERVLAADVVHGATYASPDFDRPVE